MTLLAVSPEQYHAATGKLLENGLARIEGAGPFMTVTARAHPYSGSIYALVVYPPTGKPMFYLRADYGTWGIQRLGEKHHELPKANFHALLPPAQRELCPYCQRYHPRVEPCHDSD